MSGKSKDVEGPATAVKAKAKSSSKPTTKAKSTTKSSSTSASTKKVTKSVASKAPAKKAVRAKSAAKPKIATASVAKAKPKAKVKANGKRLGNGNGKTLVIPFTEKQKETLLHLIEGFVNLHKGQPEGLLILTGVDRILNKYNQQFTEPNEKFDAIARFGIEKDPRVERKHFYINIDCRKKEVDELFVLLADIAHGKLEYASAAEQLRALHKNLQHLVKASI